MSLWMAYALSLTTIALVYWALFELLRLLYRRSVFLAVSLVLFLLPFVYVLFQVGSLTELMWVLLLTPFYGVGVMMMLFTSWMIRYYSLAFCILVALRYLFLKRRLDPWMAEDPVRHKAFWDRMGEVSMNAMSKTARVKQGIEHATSLLMGGTRKYWSLVFIVVMLTALGTTFVVFPKAGLRNPTHEEATEFVAVDQTNHNKYGVDEGACAKFAEDFKSSAMKEGYNCGYVVVYFPEGRSHALNSFNTVDKGLIFIEPQSDEIIQLTIGQPYWNRVKYEPPNYDDTVMGYRIIW